MRSGYSSLNQSARQSLSDLIQNSQSQINNDVENNNNKQQQPQQRSRQEQVQNPNETQDGEQDPTKVTETEPPQQQQEEEGEQEEEEEEEEDTPEFNNKRIILQRFTIYNSTSTMYIVGSNSKESLFRIMEISKDDENIEELSIIEDRNYFYTRKDMIELLNGLDESIDGGIHKIAQGYGMLGLIRFTKGYYLCLITKCSQVAILGGHFIYHIDETKLIPLGSNYKRPDKYSDEEKLLSIFKYMDLSKTFYFSYSYDITNTLQTNFIRNKKKATEFQFGASPNKTNDLFNNFDHNERFVWNNLLLKPILENDDVATYEWFQPIIHGFIDQANISIYGRKFYITIIARRSHHFAGARFLKRGVNDKGNVANEIETEQIVSDMLITSFHDPKNGFYNNPRYTSFVQHRGSIPLYWTQDMNKLPKPPIQINLNDPFYQSSALHFNNLFHRYGSPIIILNLIKQREKTPRESKLNQHFINCVSYLDQFLDSDHQIKMMSYDLARNSKKQVDVIGPLSQIAASTVAEIGFFHNGTSLSTTKLQKGIIRTNCIDCLDRTNAAQFIICKEALTHQLRSLKLIPEDQNLEYDSDLINVVTEMFHDHGDTIAIQYGGSNLVNTMDSYRRINQWSSHTRDMLNSIKRIYSNSFMDSIRQEAINLFLGNYVYSPDAPKLWELQNDFALHNDTSVEELRTAKKSYTHWYNDSFLHDSRNDQNNDNNNIEGIENLKLEPYPDSNDKWFNECYIPRKYQSFTELFQFNMNSNSKYFPSSETNENGSTQFDYSPFESRRKKYKNPEGDDREEFGTPRSRKVQDILGYQHKKFESTLNKDTKPDDLAIIKNPITVNEADLKLYNSQSNYPTMSTVKTQTFNPRVKTNIEDKQTYWYYSNELLNKLKDSFHGNYLDVIGPQDLKKYASLNGTNDMNGELDTRLDLNTDNNYFI
ncbi:FIG4 Polyphosphoinositide phosphatase [Candida maltosa Xu316]